VKEISELEEMIKMAASTITTDGSINPEAQSEFIGVKERFDFRQNRQDSTGRTGYQRRQVVLTP
jgi:chromosome segregation ATPase